MNINWSFWFISYFLFDIFFCFEIMQLGYRI